MKQDFFGYSRFLFFALSALLFGFNLFAEDSIVDSMTFHEGSHSFGGRIYLNFVVDTGGDYSVGLVAEPEISYFLARGFETFLNLKFDYTLIKKQVDMQRERIFRWGASLGPRYFFARGKFTPYFGIGYGFEIDNFRLSSLESFALAQVGGVYSVGKNVGFDWALPVRVFFKKDMHWDHADLRAGFFGLKTNY